jgi:hypothetical protein
MALTSEQSATVAAWVAAGDSLSVVQQKLRDEFDLSLTYMDVRFLVDDLDLTLKDAAPKADASDVSKTPPPGPAASSSAAGEKDAADAEFLDEDLPAAGGNVRVSVDGVTLIPGAMASGSVIFGDGVTGKWIIDNYGRPGFTEISREGYRPSAADSQAFMQELNLALQQKGM